MDFPIRGLPQGFFRKEMWAHLPLKYRLIPVEPPAQPCVLCLLCLSVDVGGGSVMLPLCTLYSVLYSVYSVY